MAITLERYHFKNVGILEASGNRDISRIKKYYDNRIINKRGDFRSNGISFFPDLTENEALDIIKKSGTYIVDLGSRVRDNDKLLLMCDVKLLMINVLPWRIDYSIKALENKEPYLTFDRIIAVGGINRRMTIRNRLGLDTYSLIPMEDPTLLSKKEIKRMYLLIEKYITKRVGR